MYVFKQANMYVLCNDDDVVIGDFYLKHGKAHLRKEFNEAIEKAFEVRDEFK